MVRSTFRLDPWGDLYWEHTDHQLLCEEGVCVCIYFYMCVCMYACMHAVFEFVFGTKLLGPFEVTSASKKKKIDSLAPSLFLCCAGRAERADWAFHSVWEECVSSLGEQTRDSPSYRQDNMDREDLSGLVQTRTGKK